MKEKSYGKDTGSTYMTRSQMLSSVVQELIADGFTRSDIHLALDHTKSRAAPHRICRVGRRL